MPPQMLHQIDNRTCDLCHNEDPITLHTVPGSTSFSYLCTSCVLSHHPSTFCPICFDLIDSTTTTIHINKSRAMCLRCPALVHVTCLRSPTSAAGYLCPRCSNPEFSFFDFRPCVRVVGGRRTVSLTRDLTKQLVCAAEIAAVGMRKAAEMARANAEKKAEEAIVARRRATEAIERMECLIDEVDMVENGDHGSDLDDELLI